MALKDIFNKPKYDDPGTGTAYSFNSKRIINKDGSFNVIKSGLAPSVRNTYQYLIGISWTKFLFIIFTFLFAINALFAGIYTWIGVDHINAPLSENGWDNFLEAYLFSFQTFTTVGYGALSPASKLMGIASAIEAIIGWMSFAIVTGILYGRFSKPSARLMYSKNALIAPYKDGLNSLQFRVANMRQSNLMEMEATVMLMYLERNTDGTSILKRHFLGLELERDSILFFPLNWTLVHPITKESPFHGKSIKELKETDIEILIMIKGFDDTFSNVVHSRHSYKSDEIIWGGRFVPAYESQESGDIMLHFDKMHDYIEVDLNPFET